MKKIYVKWDYTDDYGRASEENAYFDWFETLEDAEEFIEKKRKGNGGYFKLWKVSEGNFAKYLRLHELLIEIENLKEEFK